MPTKWRLAGAAAAVVAALVVAWPRVARVGARAALRARIRRLQSVLEALRTHAAAARALDGHISGTLGHPRPALRQLQRRALGGLETARAQLDANLLRLRAADPLAELLSAADSHASVRDCERRLRAELAEERAHVVRLAGSAPTTPTAPPSRPEMLREEQRTVAALERPEQPAGRLACQPSALRRAVKALRALESSLDFQAELLAEQRAVAASTGYSSANFAYGSTPLQSWVALFDAEPVRRTLSGAPSAGLRYVVLGSSLGSLVIYGACVHGLRSRGIELLPLLARTAERIAAEAGVVGASFECADMLSSDLKGSDIVLLASQCWDRTLIAAVRRKLLCELPLGALVLDYTAALGEAEESSPDRPPPLPPSGSSARRAFALACTVHAPVSWDGSHCFWVWRVVEEQPASYSY